MVRDTETDLIKNDIAPYVDGGRRSFSYDPETDKLSRTTGKLSYDRHTVEIVATGEAGNETAEGWSFRVTQR